MLHCKERQGAQNLEHKGKKAKFRGLGIKAISCHSSSC
jgi:hypothetical protein